jgi:hypothetical protein
MPKESGEIVTLELLFQCPNKHKIKSRITHIQSPNSSSLIDEQQFDLLCVRCGWREKMLGKQRLSLRLVE